MKRKTMTFNTVGEYIHNIHINENKSGFLYVKKTHLKVPVKAILKKNSKHIINVRNVLLNHITKTVHCEVLNCGVRPLNSFSPLLCSGFFGRG